MTKKKETTGNIVLAKFKKDQAKENKRKRWNRIDDAVQVARRAYTGGYDSNENEQIVSFEKALGDLIEVLQKIKSGNIKLGGLGEDDGLKIAEEG